MHLTPQEKDKLLIVTAALLAERRLNRGIKLNHPEAVAWLSFLVIEGARDINVTLFNGESFPAELVGQDPDNDIAVLKISAPVELLFPITWGDSSNLRVGQHIIAIGNPFGLERTMSTGIISSLNRQITSKTRRSIRSIIHLRTRMFSP